MLYQLLPGAPEHRHCGTWQSAVLEASLSFYLHMPIGDRLDSWDGLQKQLPLPHVQAQACSLGTPHQAKFCVDSTGKAQSKVRVTGPHGSPGFWPVLTSKARQWQGHIGMSNSLSSALLAHPDSRSLPGRDDPETRWVVWTTEAEMKIQSAPCPLKTLIKDLTLPLSNSPVCLLLSQG